MTAPAVALSHLRARGLKAFRDTEIELGPLTILSGANSAGKSTVFQAIHLAAAAAPFLQQPGRIALNRGPLALGTWDQTVNDQGQSGSQIRLVLGWSDGRAAALTFAEDPEAGFARVETAAVEADVTTRSPLGRAPRWLPAERLGPRRSHSLWSSGDEQAQNGQDVARRFERLSGDDQRTVERWLDRVAHDTPPAGSPRLRLSAHRLPEIGQVRLGFEFLRQDLWSAPRLPTQVGFGLSYALPVVLAAVEARLGDLILVENPEAHLHPRAQRHLTVLLAEASARGAQVMIETHSDHVINGARLAVKKKVLAPDDLVLQFFESTSVESQPTIVRPRCDLGGFLDHWPDGFFDEWDRALHDLHTASD